MEILLFVLNGLFDYRYYWLLEVRIWRRVCGKVYRLVLEVVYIVLLCYREKFSYMSYN